jgi:uncharacterized membrane protein
MNSLPHSEIASASEEPDVEIYIPRPMRSSEMSSEATHLLSQRFASLSGGSKALMVIGIGIVALAIVGVILQLIVWSIQLAILGIVLFLAYRFLLHSQPSA